MDSCLLRFLIVIPNNGEKSGYIHLRSISCNTDFLTLYTRGIRSLIDVNFSNNKLFRYPIEAIGFACPLAALRLDIDKPYRFCDLQCL